MQGVLTPAIELWSFESPGRLPSPHFGSEGVILSLFQSKVATCDVNLDVFTFTSLSPTWNNVLIHGMKKQIKWLKEATQWGIKMSPIISNLVVLTIIEPSFLCKVGGEIKLLLKLCTCSPLMLFILHFHPNMHFGHKPIACDFDNNIFNLSFYWTKSYHIHNTKSNCL